MFTHCVFFWLKDGISADERADFERKLEALTRIPSVVHGTVGRPAKTDRPVIDRSYHYGLMTVFADERGHDEYQVHPVHDVFRNDCARHFAKVVIYDFEGAAPR
jgi:hypothetical protein